MSGKKGKQMSLEEKARVAFDMAIKRVGLKIKLLEAQLKRERETTSALEEHLKHNYKVIDQRLSNYENRLNEMAVFLTMKNSNDLTQFNKLHSEITDLKCVYNDTVRALKQQATRMSDSIILSKNRRRDSW